MEGTKGESNPDADAASVNPTAIFGAETVKTVSKIPLLTVRAGPRDKVGKETSCSYIFNGPFNPSGHLYISYRSSPID